MANEMAEAFRSDIYKYLNKKKKEVLEYMVGEKKPKSKAGGFTTKVDNELALLVDELNEMISFVDR